MSLSIGRSLLARFRRISVAPEPGIPLRDSAGNLIKFVGTSTDIEDLKLAEEALRASETDFRLIIDTIPGMVCTLKADWEVEFVNQPLREYFGKTLEELKDWEFIGVVHPDDIERVVAKTRHSAATGEPYDVEHRCLRHDGVFRWFQVRAMPLRDAAGHLVRWTYCSPISKIGSVPRKLSRPANGSCNSSAIVFACFWI